MKKMILWLICLVSHRFYAADKIKYNSPLTRSPKPYSPKQTNASDKIDSPIIQAVINNKINNAKMLLSPKDPRLSPYDTAPNLSATKRGYTALDYACNDHNTAFVQLLLENGADPYECSANGFLPIELIFSPQFAANGNFIEGKKTFFLVLQAMHSYDNDQFFCHTIQHALAQTVSEAFKNLCTARDSYQSQLNLRYVQKISTAIDQFQQEALTAIANPTAVDSILTKIEMQYIDKIDQFE